MANDHDVLDLEVLQGKSNDRVDAVILLRVDVGDVAVHKDLAWSRVEQRRFRHTCIGT